MDSSSITPFRVNVGEVRRLDLKLTPIEIPEELRARLAAVRSSPEGEMTPPANARPDPVYAMVKVGGEVVATLYESGAAQTSNAAYGRVKNLPSMGEGEMLTGVALAQKRAEEIAAALGGRVERAAAAQSNAFAGLPQEPSAARDAGARTLLQTQMIAQWMKA